MDTIENLLRRWRKKSLWSLVSDELEYQEFNWGELELSKLLPHRSPFLLCQELRRFAPVGLDESPPGLLLGQSYLSPDDWVFAGHFPGNPVYPGVLQVEMLGQLALCLAYFQKLHKTNQPIFAPQEMQYLNIRASKILGAHYLLPVMPGKTAILQACQLGESDGIFAKVLGQLLVGDQVAMVCALEVYFVD